MAGGQGAVALGRSVPHLRVPALVRWPAQLPAGQERQTPCMSMDWLPTLLRAAGVTPAPQLALDGCDLLPMLQGADVEPERFAQLQAAYADWAAQMLPYPQRQWPGIRAVKDRFRNLG